VQVYRVNSSEMHQNHFCLAFAAHNGQLLYAAIEQMPADMPTRDPRTGHTPIGIEITAPPNAPTIEPRSTLT
jgi:hypothetical protein